MPTDLYWLPPHQDWKQELAGLASVAHAELWRRLVRLANYRIDFIQTARLERAVEKYFDASPPAAIDTKPMKLAVLASSTVNYLLPAIRVGALRRGIQCKTYRNAYGQYLYELLDGKSALTQFQPDVVLLSFDAHHLADSAKRASGQAEQSLEAIANCWRLVKEKFRCTIVQQTLLQVFPPLLGNNEQNLKDSPNAVVAEINSRLRQTAARAGVHLLAGDLHAAIDGLSTWTDPASGIEPNERYHRDGAFLWRSCWPNPRGCRTCRVSPIWLKQSCSEANAAYLNKLDSRTKSST